MERQMRKRLLLLLFALFPACSTTTPVTTVAKQFVLRSSVFVDGSNLKLAVVLESSDGESVSGAAASFTDPGGGFNSLPFSFATGAYSYSGPASNGTYKIELQSLAAGAKSTDLPVKVLSPAPNITLTRDAEGSSVQEFQKLKASTAIEVVWLKTLQAQRYLIEGRQAGKTVFSKIIPATNDDSQSTLIPAGTFEGSLTGNAVTLMLTASSTSGDPKFVTAKYVSSSSLVGPSLSFQVIP
jgi:hypothetical protein